MGLISKVLGGGVGAAADAVVDVAEVFRPNATREMELGHEAFTASLSQHGAEFQYGRVGWFDRLMNGLNRLPRPMLALGTLGMFVYAMVDPLSFAERMKGLDYVPEPMWWLLGAIVSFYFGARELHYRRRPPTAPSNPPSRRVPSTNPALEAWRSERGG
ncbi:holin family protein [Litoreibacter janthinus]|uniref:Holin of 3TMs, for gene-transfer release n=1 Tax=Litoreibacter janthinus TaxID=670154 RepID=A0A1I6H3Q2_9RHOB|nr:holin family protein [Litoreibacter janthinus]SFR49062.1 Holin of 3TMs, for gene-transfer release [Litoreibacter janthinus]